MGMFDSTNLKVALAAVALVTTPNTPPPVDSPSMSQLSLPKPKTEVRTAPLTLDQAIGMLTNPLTSEERAAQTQHTLRALERDLASRSKPKMMMEVGSSCSGIRMVPATHTFLEIRDAIATASVQSIESKPTDNQKKSSLTLEEAFAKITIPLTHEQKAKQEAETVSSLNEEIKVKPSSHVKPGTEWRK